MIVTISYDKIIKDHKSLRYLCAMVFILFIFKEAFTIARANAQGISKNEVHETAIGSVKYPITTKSYCRVTRSRIFMNEYIKRNYNDEKGLALFLLKI